MTTPAAAKLYLAQHEYEHEGKRHLVFNPKQKPFEELPEIMCFSNVVGGGDGIAYAMAEDGHVLGSHWCSNEGYVKADLGVLMGCREDRHEHYQKHYPEGYRMSFIPSSEIEGHDKLNKAFKLNDKLKEESENDTN